MIFRGPPPERDPLRAQIDALYHVGGSAVMETLRDEATLAPPVRSEIEGLARRLIEAVRSDTEGAGSLEAFLQEYGLSTQEGIALMCLAEALLRIPDGETQSLLIRDKLRGTEWERHLGKSPSLFVNASTFGLMLTGRFVRLSPDLADAHLVERLAARMGEPIVREAIGQAVRILSNQFVLGRTIGEALSRAADSEKEGLRHSFDMLGEAALTEADAERYAAAYAGAIAEVGRRHGSGAHSAASILDRPGISIKLSALHPRFEYGQRTSVLRRLVPRLQSLVHEARELGVGVTIDAEEANRLDLQLDVFSAMLGDGALAGWEGFGIAVQAYQKRARPVIDWLAAEAARVGRRIPVRLVKGAYWDTEVKRAQEGGFPGYPVFTRKALTDVSYLACARALLERRELLPQFATHNAHTLAAVVTLARHANRDRSEFECQRLHGMGAALYRAARAEMGADLRCRIYAPVGNHADLLPYLVRRLLENGANTSFVNRILDLSVPVERLVRDPVEAARTYVSQRNPRIPLPADLYGSERRNSAGMDLSDPLRLAALAAEMGRADRSWSAAPLVAGKRLAGAGAAPVTDPADRRRTVGTVVEADAVAVEAALAAAAAAADGWDGVGAHQRADLLDRVADRFEAHTPELMALAVREAGKTLADAVSEVREAVDFCRYYAVRARADFAQPRALPGPTGESNTLALRGRGVFACISPWNFPLAIFTGQVAAALAAGNAVIAKPAEQTPLMAMRAVELMLDAGIPAEVLHLLPGDGARIGGALVADARISGVAMTGSVETAHLINRGLAAREGPIVPLIAETGGQNALIADSSALAEQLVADVLRSAFNSAGQRCSALRVLFLQNEIADRVIEMLSGGMAELRVGDPAYLATDVGPVIDDDARRVLQEHIARMQREGRLIAASPLGADCDHGTFLAPHAFEIDSIGRLTHEVFGPILHVVRFDADDLDAVVDSVNATAFGLTFGIHSRIDATIRRIRARARVGNVYVNRNIIGAVVGVQPFGGEGLSGTGPKAGGPHYLPRFATERVVSVNTVAMGGNPALLSLGEEGSE